MVLLACGMVFGLVLCLPLKAQCQEQLILMFYGIAYFMSECVQLCKTSAEELLECSSFGFQINWNLHGPRVML